MSSMYETIMDLPLFQGMSHEKVSELIEKTKFHFLKYKTGDCIISSGDDCGHVRFVVSGSVRVEYSIPNRKVVVSEDLEAPSELGVDYLFGMNTVYPFKVTALEDCGILQIDKNDYIQILQSDKVFLFNLLNILSRNSQKGVYSVLCVKSGTIGERLALMVEILTHRKGKNIRFSFKQKDMCQIFGAQRTSFINALNTLTKLGMITYNTGEIQVQDRDQLMEILNSREE